MNTRRRDLLQQSVAMGAAALMAQNVSAETPAVVPPASTSGTEANGRQDFDFFLGHWRVAARRLRQRLTPTAHWEPVTGTTHVFAILNGAGNLDEDEFQLSSGVYIGGMLRLFDTQKNLWFTYGLDRDSGALQPPLSGRFHGARGEFLGEDSEGGRPIQVRHLYLSNDSNSCRWEQAFSVDGGKQWETNWIIDFTRMAAPPER